MTAAARRFPLLVEAAALALGSAVALGLVRFAYALLLPAMRSDLGWSYLTSGAMNTVNAAGYLAGALAAPVSIRAAGARRALIVGTVATGLALAAHGLVASDAGLYAMRFLAGVASAVGFVAGGVLAARLAGRADAGPSSAGLVLGIYYGGTGLGVVASAWLAPLLAARPVVHAWQGAWIGLGLLGVAGAAVTALVVRPAGDSRVGPTATTDAAAPAATESSRFDWRPFLPGLAAYLCFGIGYIGYVTFVVTLLREQGHSDAMVAAFFAVLGAAVIVSPWLWAGLLQRRKGGEPMTLLNALVAVATLLPVLPGLGASVAAVFASGLLFGAVLLSVVASTTALVRHNLPPAGWAAGIGGFTIVFASGQIVGPSLVGYVADHVGLRTGLAVAAAVLALASAFASRQRPLRA